MQAQHIMSRQPVCCTAATSLWEVARLMSAHNCGAIPVVENTVTMKVVGIVTDRDITCRAVARGHNPLEMIAADCMTGPVATVRPGASVEECCRTMERNHLRRLVVADERGSCLGIVSQSDITAFAPEHDAMTVVRQASHHRAPARPGGW